MARERLEVKMKLKITKGSYETIQEESLNTETETGGLLIGTLEVPIVIRASKPGTLANKSWACYTNDSDYDNLILAETIKEFGGKVKNIGHWHKHPGSMSELSSTDLATAQEIAQTNEHDGDRRPVFYIVTNVNSNGVKFYCYVLDPYIQKFEPVKMEVIDDNAEEVKKALSIEPIIIQPQEIDFWRNEDFQFYLTEVGFKRLKQEVDQLQTSGYDVKVHANGQLRLRIYKDGETIMCFPPPEYPLNPPRFFRDNIELFYSLPIWNSSFRIADILETLDKQDKEKRTHENHRTEASSRVLGLIKKLKRTIEPLWHDKKKRRSRVRHSNR